MGGVQYLHVNGSGVSWIGDAKFLGCYCLASTNI